MEAEFDKEIDILLRQAARSGDAAEFAGMHPDADEINAFAENALSEKSRLRAVNHFADCARCRKILAELTILNRGTESEIVHTKEDKTILAAPEIPWYRKLFMFPQIAYAMGALALIFGGIIAVIVFKDTAQNSSSDVAQANRQSASPSVFSENDEADSSAAATNSTAVTNSNSAAIANSNATAVLPTPEIKINQTNGAANTSTAEARNKTVETAKSAPKPAAGAPDDAETIAKANNNETLTALPPPASKKENNYTRDETVTVEADTARRQSEPSQNQVSRNQTQITPDSRSVQNLPMVTRRAEPSRETAPASGSSANTKDGDKSVETKTVGGKNFRRADGVWYDVNYRNQPTINVRRSSNEYKKLDANLRAAADKLGGVVVIVAGGKAYRIQ